MQSFEVYFTPGATDKAVSADISLLIRSSRQYTLAAQIIRNVSPWRAFYILVKSFSNQDVHVPKNMKMDHIANPPSVIEIIGTVATISAHTKTPMPDFNYITSEESASSQVRYHDPGGRDILTVHCKPPECRAMQISGHKKCLERQLPPSKLMTSRSTFRSKLSL